MQGSLSTSVYVLALNKVFGKLHLTKLLKQLKLQKNHLKQNNIEIIYAFNPRDAMPARYLLSSCVCPSVRPSVCPSVTSRHCTKTAERRITQTTPYDNTKLHFSDAKNLVKILTNWVTPNGGAK